MIYVLSLCPSLLLVPSSALDLECPQADLRRSLQVASHYLEGESGNP